jgi:hypothetical protein
MATTKPRHLLRLDYEKAAEVYLRSLPPEHFMEATTPYRFGNGGTGGSVRGLFRNSSRITSIARLSC